MLVLKEILDFVGIDSDRLEVVWVSSAEGPRFAREMTRFIEHIRQMGPLGVYTVASPPFAVSENENHNASRERSALSACEVQRPPKDGEDRWMKG